VKFIRGGAFLAQLKPLVDVLPEVHEIFHVVTTRLPLGEWVGIAPNELYMRGLGPSFTPSPPLWPGVHDGEPARARSKRRPRSPDF
jgi:hypothetical protein